MLCFNYTKNEEDLKFVIFCYDSSAKFHLAAAMSLVVDSSTTLSTLDSVIEKIFNIAGEEYNEKKLSEFKSLRRAPMVPKEDFTPKSLISYIRIVEAMLSTGSLKHKESIDRYTRILVERGIKFDPEFYMLEIRAGMIASIRDAEGLDRLYCENVKANKDYFICSGLKEHYKKEDLEANTYLFLLNIKKGKFKNLESEGMICCAVECAEEKIEAIKVQAEAGKRINLEGHLEMFEDLEYGKMDPSKAAFKKILSELRIEGHKLCFKGTRVMVGGEFVETVIETGAVR